MAEYEDVSGYQPGSQENNIVIPEPTVSPDLNSLRQRHLFRQFPFVKRLIGHNPSIHYSVLWKFFHLPHRDNVASRVELPGSVMNVEPRAFEHTAWLKNFRESGEDFLITGGTSSLVQPRKARSLICCTPSPRCTCRSPVRAVVSRSFCPCRSLFWGRNLGW